MPAGDLFPPGGLSEVDILRRQLDRERRTREQAEEISERAMRELYERQRALELLEAVADAANAATSIEAVLRVAIERICVHAGWPVGHAYLRDETGVMRSTSIWHTAYDRFDELCAATAQTTFLPGVGLPGRVAATGRPAWIEDVLEDDNFPRAQHAADLGVHAAFGQPVLVGDEVVAVLEFFAAVPLGTDPDLVRLVGQAAIHLARVVERVRGAQQLQHQASHDALTGLPNRRMLLEHLEVALARSERSPGLRHAVLFVDLDGFKRVNDTMGHAAGDAVLREVARRLGDVKRRSDVLGRLSGDEFVLICQDLPADHHGGRICQRLFERLDKEFVVRGDRFKLSASVGVAFSERGSEVGAERLLQHADAAMYLAKKEPGCAFVVHDHELRARISRRMSMESALREAPEAGGLFLAYQPEVDVVTGAVVGAEALVRWRRGGRVIFPNEFIPLAEETGLIVPIGLWVVEEACRQAAEWTAEFGDGAPWVAVNLSVRQLADPTTPEGIARVLRRYPELTGRIFFEVTESMLLDDAERGLEVLARLKALGGEIAIDDFGTGYASLSYLRRFPASVVKIDRSFVSELGERPESTAIVASVIELAHALGLGVVAEGVETQRQLSILEGLRCDLAQGYWFSRPERPERLTAILRSDAPFATA